MPGLGQGNRTENSVTSKLALAGARGLEPFLQSGPVKLGEFPPGTHRSWTANAIERERLY